jgi:predicted anti-sigma-YlaC factor YlaD
MPPTNSDILVADEAPGHYRDEHVGTVAPDGHRPMHRSHFWRHFAEMLGVMVIGMFATGYIIVRIGGLTSWDRATIVYPTQCLLGMAIGMSLPMVVWMLFRGMGWRNAAGMAAVMIVPVIPFLSLVWFNVTASAWCGAYCASSAVAMLALMRSRRSEYSMQM